MMLPSVDSLLVFKRTAEDELVDYWYDPRIYFCAVVRRCLQENPIEWRIETDKGELLSIELERSSGKLHEVTLVTYDSPIRLAPSLVGEAAALANGLPEFDISASPSLYITLRPTILLDWQFAYPPGGVARLTLRFQ
jgi:hypothetical protein